MPPFSSKMEGHIFHWELEIFLSCLTQTETTSLHVHINSYTHAHPSCPKLHKRPKNAILLKIIRSSHLPLRIGGFLSILIQREFPYIYPPQVASPALRKRPNHYRRKWHACLNPIRLSFWRHSKLVGITTISGRSKSPLQNYLSTILHRYRGL